MIATQPPPERLVDAHGQVTFGVFDAPLRTIDLEYAHLRWRGVPLPAPLGRLRLKQWQHVGLVLDDVFVGLAVVDAGFLHTTWCHVVDRVGGGHFEHARKAPRLDLHVPRALWNERCHVHARGYRIDIGNRLDHGEHTLAVAVEADGDRPAVEASLRCAHDLSEIDPLVVVLPVGPNRGMYSHKVALPLEGTLRVGDRAYEADPATCFAIWDVHKAHYPRHTFWNWATFAGRDAEGRALALNLTRNVNRDDARLNENGLWVDGRLAHLGPARFHFDRARALEPWRLTTDCGAVDLTFEPQGERREDLRLGVVKSVFRQPYGTFWGRVTFHGEDLEVEGLFGVCEDHEAVW